MCIPLFIEIILLANKIYTWYLERHSKSRYNQFLQEMQIKYIVTPGTIDDQLRQIIHINFSQKNLFYKACNHPCTHRKPHETITLLRLHIFLYTLKGIVDLI